MYTDRDELISRLGKELYHEITQLTIFETSLATSDTNIFIKSPKNQQISESKALKTKNNDCIDGNNRDLKKYTPKENLNTIQNNKDKLYIDIGSKSTLAKPNLEHNSLHDSETTEFVVSKKKLQHNEGNYIKI